MEGDIGRDLELLAEALALVVGEVPGVAYFEAACIDHLHFVNQAVNPFFLDRLIDYLVFVYDHALHVVNDDGVAVLEVVFEPREELHEPVLLVRDALDEEFEALLAVLVNDFEIGAEVVEDVGEDAVDVGADELDAFFPAVAVERDLVFQEFFRDDDQLVLVEFQ